MAFDFAAAKLNARRVVHETLGVSALYQDSSLVTPEPIRVRWHTKIDRFGDLENSGYAEVIEGLERVILQAEQARAIGVKQNGVITITWPDASVTEVVLSAREPADGPYEEIWTVAQK